MEGKRIAQVRVEPLEENDEDEAAQTQLMSGGGER
jgi:hypothetical protein